MNVITCHGDPARLGTETGVTGPGSWSKRYEADLVTHPAGEAGAAVRGAPLFLRRWRFEIGPYAGQEHDVVIVVSSDNRAYAYADEAAGPPSLLWTRFLGAPLDKTGSNISPPAGTASTPVADLDGGRLSVVTLRDNGAGTGQFWISALDLDTGSVIQDALLADPGGAGRPVFDPTTLDQRGGLNLVNGFVMATFADFLAYDEGPYHGWVVATAASNLYRQAFLPLTQNVTGGRHLVVVSAKDGDVYLLNARKLGHWGNELWRAHVFGAEAKCAPAYYRSHDRHHHVYVVGSDVPGLVAYRVAGTSLIETWRADGGPLSLGDSPGSPVVAATPRSEALVWIADAGDGTSPVLLAYDALTGALVYTSAAQATDATGPLPHFLAITRAGPNVYLATAKGYACYSHRP